MNNRLIAFSRLAVPAITSLLLAACGSSNIKPNNPAIDHKETAAAATSGTKPATPSKSGGYYLDDGPGDNPPADIDAIPDAVPRVEAPLPRANRPYIALGTRYTPMTEYAPYKERGIASWYGRRYHGQKTSSGEIYDMYGMTGAHTILPLPSYARVTNPENGRSVIVRINDRGPFHSDRLIDLSYAAAYKLRLIGKGSGLVEVEAIDARNNGAISGAASTSLPKPITPATDAVANPAAAAEAPIELTAETTLQTPPPATGDYVQVGAFKYKENADGLRQRLEQQNLTGNVPVERWYNNGLYRVRLGPYASRQAADNAASQIRQALSTSAMVLHQP